MKYTRTTISIPEHVLVAGQARAERFRLSFSDYLARLVEEEAKSQRATLTIVAEDPPEYHSAATVRDLERAAKKLTKAPKARKRQAAKKSAA